MNAVVEALEKALSEYEDAATEAQRQIDRHTDQLARWNRTLADYRESIIEIQNALDSYDA